MAKQAANDSIKTRINGNWPGVKMEQKQRKQARPSEPVKMETLKKTRTPYIVPRLDRGGKKYDDLFYHVKEGDCFECPPDKTPNIAKALRVYCRKKKIDGVIKQNSRFDDGVGRVWLYKVYGLKAAA